MTAAIERYGYDPRTTPLDTLMDGPDAMHHDVAHEMNHPEENEDDG